MGRLREHAEPDPDSWLALSKILLLKSPKVQ